MTKAEWQRALRPGMSLRCTYRWYWGPKNPAPPGGELCAVTEVRATQLIMKTPKHDRSFLHFPKASELKADEKGFELYFPLDDKTMPGELMSRYEYVADEQAVLA